MDPLDLAANNAYPTPYANTSIMPLLLLSLAQQRFTPTTKTEFKEEYDYIIVGAGTAGSVVASRLSEVPCVSVLLLEAGKSPPQITDVVALSRSFWSSDLDWAYKTVPQKHTGNGLVNNQVIWASGKAVGGSGILNAMAYVRGNKLNYDDWAKHGAVGWSFSDTFPYFLKLEDNREPDMLANGYHVVGGPVTVSEVAYHPEIQKSLLEAADELDIEFLDINGFKQTGICEPQGALRDGQRCNTAKAYLVPAENRTNLDILPNAFVRKVLIKQDRAVGVRFEYKGKKHDVRARREVIMSAGTTNTAQLLMLSGIGPKKHLKKFKIPVVADLPVGNNFQDHGATSLFFHLDSDIPTITQKFKDPETVQKYIYNRTGPLLSLGSTLIGFLNENSNPEVDFPNYQIYFAEANVDVPRFSYGVKPEVYDKVFAPYEKDNVYLCVAQNLQPKSRGTVRLNSSNPHDPPLIDPNYLHHPEDIKDIVHGMKMCHAFGTSETMQEIGSKPLETLWPGCEKYADDDDRYFECYARSLILTTNHQVGTAKMGDPEDPTTVVDPQLRVKDIKGLRVVDASIMPIIPSGNTYIPTVMLAEKASDIIKNSINCPTQRSGRLSKK